MYAAAPAAKTRLAPICIEAPLPEWLLVALALAESVLVPEAKPDCTIPDSELSLVVVVAVDPVADAALALVVVPYTEAALQFCSRCCWTMLTPTSLGQLL
jgi:hypothetical protein